VYGTTIWEPNMFTTFWAVFLFLAPEVHLAELKNIWVDSIINKVAWKEFIQKLHNEWTDLTLYVCPETFVLSVI